MTVLFVDVTGSVGLSGSVDTEVWWRVMGPLFGLISQGVHRFEGRVDQFTGDGAMAVFGAPVAQEDHAQRACHAALWLRREVVRYAQELERDRGMRLAVRMGLDSGEVVVGTIGDARSRVYAAIGHTAAVAQRMESLAKPGSAYLTARTAALVEGFFSLRDVGETRVKGLDQPMRAFELAWAGRMRTSLERSEARGFSPFVGREDELASLHAALTAAADGRGRVVTISGEPGAGKSRLCREFLEQSHARGVEAYPANAVAHAHVRDAVGASRSRFEPGTLGALLEAEQWLVLGRLGRRRAFQRNAMMMYEGEPGDRVMVLLEGRVKITRIGIDGRETLLSIRGPGDILGELSFIDEQARIATVTALEPVKALLISAREFRGYVSETPGVALTLLTVLTRRFRDAAIKRTQFKASDTIGRVAARLVELVERYGEPSDVGVVIGVPLSQEELGAWVVASHAGIAKALQVLRELGGIETERRRMALATPPRATVQPA